VGERYRHCVEYVAEAGLSPQEQAAVLGENARVLLGL
jgi:predicted TIM-barrel fold metal-dependent hydrolase